jgi:putative ABC transport system substrate-binding protein
MKRRQFLGVLGGAAASWPLAVQAQQADRVRRVGILMGIAEADPTQKALLSALRLGLQSLGWIEGQNIRIDTRWGAGDADRIRGFAQELVAARPDLIVGHTTPVVAALLQQTRSIPIVFAQVSDPIGSGFVASLAHPGGNATGFTNLEASMSAKLIGLLKEVAPPIARVALLFNPDTAPDGGSYFMRPAEAAARTLQIDVAAAPVHNVAEIDAAVDNLVRVPNGGLIVMPDVFVLAHREQILALTARHRLPAAYAYRVFSENGGLLSYGTDLVDLFRRTAPYVDKILKGATPGELPVQQPTKFELVINLKTAKALGLTISDSFSLRADEVIE